MVRLTRPGYSRTTRAPPLATTRSDRAAAAEVFTMFRFLILRTLRAIVTLWAISVVTFVLFFMFPASPAQVMCGRNCAPSEVANVMHVLGLDQPKLHQYTEFVKGIFVGRDYGSGDFSVHCDAPCLGYDYQHHEKVTEILIRTAPVSMSIAIGGAILWVSFGVILGLVSAIRRGTVLDKAAIGVTLVGASTQTYVFGLILLFVFVFKTKLLPFPSWTVPWVNPGQFVLGMLLPWMTLGFLNAALYARLTRAQMLEILSEDYVRTARAKGLPRRSVLLRHAFRAAVNPIVTIAGLDLGFALGGVIITESVFGMPGLGYQTVQAAYVEDLPVVVATVLLAAVFIVVANIVVDALYAVIDPRVRLA
jgi:peptide/nickel transport system permease protein